jgi:tyrosinase
VWLGGQWNADIYTGSFSPTTSIFVGTMSALDCSPNDPVFFLHHCNVDRIWAAWEERYGASYAPDSGWNQGWNLNDELYPYVQFRDVPEMQREGITNASMLDFRSLGYTYDDLLT